MYCWPFSSEDRYATVMPSSVVVTVVAVPIGIPKLVAILEAMFESVSASDPASTVTRVVSTHITRDSYIF
jgi:hypothetical protein